MYYKRFVKGEEKIEKIEHMGNVKVCVSNSNGEMYLFKTLVFSIVAYYTFKKVEKIP